jgi:hypothetical protein
VQQAAGFDDREKPGGLVAADAEGMRQAGRQVEEAAGVQLVVLLPGTVIYPALEQVEGLGLAGVTVQRRGHPRRLGHQRDAHPAGARG